MTTQHDNIRRARIDLDIRAAIIDQLNTYGGRCSAAEIYRYLNLQREFLGRIPQLRSVQRVVKEYRDQHPLEEWHWSQYPDGDARILLDVMAVVFEFKEMGQNESMDAHYDNVIDPETGNTIGIGSLGMRLTIRDDFQWTDRFAEWVIKVSKVAPEISPISLFQIARYYLLSFELNLATEGLDVMLAMRDWEGSLSLWRHVRMVSLNERPKISAPGGHVGVLLAILMDVIDRDKNSEGVEFVEELDSLTTQRHKEIEKLILEAAK